MGAFIEQPSLCEGRELQGARRRTRTARVWMSSSSIAVKLGSELSAGVFRGRLGPRHAARPMTSQPVRSMTSSIWESCSPLIQWSARTPAASDPEP